MSKTDITFNFPILLFAGSIQSIFFLPFFSAFSSSSAVLFSPFLIRVIRVRVCVITTRTREMRQVHFRKINLATKSPRRLGCKVTPRLHKNCGSRS